MNIKRGLLISCFNWYKGRLEPIRKELLSQGYEVKILISDFDHLKKIPIEKRYSECTYIHVPLYKNNISLGRIVSHMAFGNKVGEIISRTNPDLVYCLIPPNNVAKHCVKYKYSHPQTKLILDIIDLWPESMPWGRMKNTLPARAWKKWRDAAIAYADHVFTECDLYQEKLRSVLDPDKTSTLYLFKEQSSEERALVQEIISKEQQDNIIRFAYLGSMNNIIDIDGICGVIKQFIESGCQCELHSIGDGESRVKFETAVNAVGCSTYFYGSVFNEAEKIKILAPCDYAFNMMKGEISVGLTIKSIDYLSYGLPIINNIKGDTWRLVEKEGIGMNVYNNQFIHQRKFGHNKILEVFNTRFERHAFHKKISDLLKGL